MRSSEKRPAAAAQRDEVLVDLGLQGGGSHGAFTWGVLAGCLKNHGCGLTGYLGHPPGR